MGAKVSALFSRCSLRDGHILHVDAQQLLSTEREFAQTSSSFYSFKKQNICTYEFEHIGLNIVLKIYSCTYFISVEYHQGLLGIINDYRLLTSILIGKSSVSKLDDLRRKYSVMTDKLHRVHNDYVLSMKEGCAYQEGLVSTLLPMYMSAQQDYCQDSIVQW